VFKSNQWQLLLASWASPPPGSLPVSSPDHILELWTEQRQWGSKVTYAVQRAVGETLGRGYTELSSDKIAQTNWQHCCRLAPMAHTLCSQL